MSERMHSGGAGLCPRRHGVRRGVFEDLHFLLLPAKERLLHRVKPKAIRTFGIASRKERCIACGMCDRFCEVGVPVKSFALKGQFFDMSNTSCIGCGICISVCPTRVLSYSTMVPLTIAPTDTLLTANL